MSSKQQRDELDKLIGRCWKGKVMGKTYYISLDNMVAVSAETEEQAREAAKSALLEILQRDKEVVLDMEEDNE